VQSQYSSAEKREIDPELYTPWSLAQPLMVGDWSEFAGYLSGLVGLVSEWPGTIACHAWSQFAPN
jgi:hypothetical protein